MLFTWLCPCLTSASCDQTRHLWDDGESGAERVQPEALNVDAVDADGAARRLNDAKQRQCHG